MRIIQYDDLLQAELSVERLRNKLLVSVFLIDGLLIDTGPTSKEATLISLYNAWDIREVILTHHHEDHTGLAGWLQRNRNIPIYIHQLGIDSCVVKEKLPLYRRLFWGNKETFRPLPLEQTFNTPHYTWDIIHTPGHAHDHVALYNREKDWMFGGDLYVQSKPRSAFSFESIPIMIASLKKVLTYDFDTYICSHIGIVKEGRKAIKNKLNYLIKMEERVLYLHEKGMSPNQIKVKLFPKNHFMTYISLFESSPKHIVTSIINHYK